MRTITFFTKIELKPIELFFTDYFKNIIYKLTDKKYLSDMNTDNLFKIYNYLQKEENQRVLFAEFNRIIDEKIKKREEYIKEKEKQIKEENSSIRREKRIKNMLKNKDFEKFIQEIQNEFNS